jgi:hypothetical protein
MKFGGNNLREAATKEAFDCLVLSTKKYVTLLRETSILACIYIYIYISELFSVYSYRKTRNIR